MRLFGHALCALVVGGSLLLPPRPTFAQRAVGEDAAAVRSLDAECSRLRAELERVNGEIAALKRADRGVRDDYRLREKMADAEALARRVMAAEARLRAARGPIAHEAGTAATSVAQPVATAQDGSVELEAKADLLMDQARRYRADADSLVRTAAQVRERQNLRRRAGAWDRDPFAGFEASKRSVVLQSPTRTTAPGSNSASTGGDSSSASGVGSHSTSGTPGSTTSGSPATVSIPGESGSKGATTPQSDPTRGGSSSPTFGLPPSTDGTGSTGAGELGPGSGPSLSLSPTLSPTPSAVKSVGIPFAADAGGRAAQQQRTLLDPDTLASIRSSLAHSGSQSDPDAIEAAAASLRKHAQALEAQAKILRTRAAGL